MGRSPGKWIKTVLFGKKTSRSKSSKGRDDLVPTADLAVNPSLTSQREPILNRKSGENSDLEQCRASNLPSEGVVLVPGDQGAGKQGTTASDGSSGPDRIKQEQAATKAQAAFRGYLARRAFRALMGIIRLQALVRGHLVRRQAVATLHCVLGIVKFQALIRGQREDAKVSNQRTFTHAEKIMINSFIRKLHVSSPNTHPLCLQYDLGEPNSAWCWLERWTFSRVWEPLPQPKKVTDSKSQTRPKRSVRKQAAASIDNGSVRSTLPSEKPKRNTKKVSGHPVDVTQESSQNELEKVKRNLRKISNPINETNQNEVETEKPKRIPRKTPSSSAPDVSDRVMGEPTENEKLKHIPKALGSKSECSGQVDAESERLKSIPRKSYSQATAVPDHGMTESAGKKKDSPEQSSEHPVEAHTPKPLTENEIMDVMHDDHSKFDSSALENNGKEENTPMTNGKIVSTEDQASNDNQKSSRRRASLSTKQEHPEVGSQNSPKLPSYMAATESAKAKLRAQGSPRSAVTDVIDQNGLTRRHSLPSSTNGKMSSLSPRTQRPQANGKGTIKHERSILSSKDGNEKVAQEWKR